MFKNMVEFAYQEGERILRFVADNDVDLNIAERALIDFLQRIGKIKEQIVAIQKEQADKAESSVVTPIEEEYQKLEG